MVLFFGIIATFILFTNTNISYSQTNDNQEKQYELRFAEFLKSAYLSTRNINFYSGSSLSRGYAELGLINQYPNIRSQYGPECSHVETTKQIFVMACNLPQHTSVVADKKIVLTFSLPFLSVKKFTGSGVFRFRCTKPNCVNFVMHGNLKASLDEFFILISPHLENSLVRIIQKLRQYRPIN